MASGNETIDGAADTLARAADCVSDGSGERAVVSGGEPSEPQHAAVDPAKADTVEGAVVRPASGPASVGEDLARSKIASALFGTAVPTIGRYTVLQALGSGGMGAVYAAYDDKLDRRIAIKLLHRTGPTAAERLLAEARALARVEHPNVVAVHDVGEDGDRVYIAMEFVRGGDLRQWLRERRTWRETIEVFLQAGRGLAAAHQAGVLHRDFKPENALISEDGRVRVGDFGLAVTGVRATEAVTGDPMVRDSFAGAIVGTPPYMPLEQLRGQTLDTRADQYAFCVSLFEALYGQRPFRGDTLAELEAVVEAGVVDNVDAAGEVPRWVRPIVVRGLAPDPDARWPSMAALLEALERPLHPRRGRIGWAATAVAIVAAAAAIGTRDEAGPSCDGAQALVQRDFSDAAREQAARAFAAAAPTWGPDAWARTEARLADYAQAWSERYRYFCEATHVRHELSVERLDSRVRCLERRWQRVSTLMEIFAKADVELVERSATAVESLSPPETCPDDEGAPPVPPALVETVQALALRVEESEALQAAGRYEDARRVAAAAFEEAQEIDYEPSRARAAIRYGTMLWVLEDDAGALQHLREGYLAAHALDLVELMIAAAHELSFVVGQRQVDLERALVWSDLEAASLRRLGDAARPAQWANYRRGRATIHTEAGKLDEALELMREALESEATVTEDPLAVATTLNNFAVTLHRAGRHAEAVKAARRAVTIREDVQGPDHPMTLQTINVLVATLTGAGADEEAVEVAGGLLERARRVLGTEASTYGSALGNRANALANLQRLDEALADYRAAEQILPPDSIRLGPIFVSRAMVLRRQGKLEEARATLQRALEVYQQHLPPGHYNIAVVLSNLANLASDLGDHAESIDLSRRALAMFEDGAAGSASRARTEGNLAMSLVALDRHDEAIAIMDAAVARLAAADPVDRDVLGKARRTRGGVLLSVGRHAEAVEELTLALPLLESAAADPHYVGEACESMARARAALGAPEAEVRGWVERAAESYRAEQGFERQAEALEQWWATARGSSPPARADSR